MEVSNGQSSEVYQVRATMSWSGRKARPSKVTKKVCIYMSDEYSSCAKLTAQQLACKRLRHITTPSQFYREYQNLQSANRLHHPNIVQMIAAFRFEEDRIQYYNILFPLAIGTLKQLFAGQLGKPSKRFWSQFEGLASAVAYLHSECNTAHRDLKSSNILLYRNTKTPGFTAKIADFGLAVNLQDAKSWAFGTTESQSALRYGAPEMRKYEDPISQPPLVPAPASTRLPNAHFPLPEELRAADVWTLGCIFVQMLSFLVLGPDWQWKFRIAITTTKDNITTDQLDDGVNIKEEVLGWLSEMGRLDAQAKEIGPLVKTMLAPASNRPSSTTVWEQLLTVCAPPCNYTYFITAAGKSEFFTEYLMFVFYHSLV